MSRLDDMTLALRRMVQPVLADLRKEAHEFIVAMTTQLDNLQTTSDDHATRITALETTGATIETRLAALEAEVHSHAPTGVPPFAGQPQ